MQNSSMPWADVVIPVTTMYECDHPFEAPMMGMGTWIMARNKVIEPLGDYKSDYQFWLDLAVKMGYGEDFWHGSMEECMNYQLENFGMTIDELRAHPTGIMYQPKPMVYEKYSQIFATPSSRINKAPYLPQGKVAIYNTTFEIHIPRTCTTTGGCVTFLICARFSLTPGYIFIQIQLKRVALVMATG
jgi:anaerobic selenocysteine-containing dehydrogenase